MLSRLGLKKSEIDDSEYGYYLQDSKFLQYPKSFEDVRQIIKDYTDDKIDILTFGN